MGINNRVSIIKIVLLSFLIIKPIFAEDSTILNLKYQNSLLDANIKSAIIKDIFEELKKQAGLTYEIEKEIQEQKVTISFKEKELTQAIKDILNTIGNPSYMLSYKKDKDNKYQVANITIKKHGSLSLEVLVKGEKMGLQVGEIEIGLVDDPKWKYKKGKYKIHAKDVNVNDLLDRLYYISGSKIVAVRIDKKIDFEGEASVVNLLDDIINKLRPKIYRTGPNFGEVDSKGNVIKEGYYEVTQLSDAEIRQRREKAEKANAEGEKLMKQGRYLEAIEKFENVMDPDDINSDLNLGKIYLMDHNYSMAIGSFNRALDIDSNNADVYLGLIEAYEKTGQIDKAVEIMGKYISVSKDEKKIKDIKKKMESLNDKAIKDYYSFIEKGDEYKSKQDIDKAKVEYENALKIKPDLVFAYLKMAEIYENAKDFSKAEVMYKKAIEQNKTDYEVYLRLASMYMNIGKIQDSIELMKRAVKVCPVKDTVDRINEMLKTLEQRR